MPCLPGFLPVLIEVQATADTSGCEEVISTAVPVSNVRAKLGRSPDAMRRRRRGSGEPSRPRMKSRLCFWDRKNLTGVIICGVGDADQTALSGIGPCLLA